MSKRNRVELGSSNKLYTQKFMGRDADNFFEKIFKFQNEDLARSFLPQNLSTSAPGIECHTALFDSLVIKQQIVLQDSPPNRSFHHYSKHPAEFRFTNQLHDLMMEKRNKTRKKQFDVWDLEYMRLEKIYEMQLLVVPNKKDLVIHHFERNHRAANSYRGSGYRGVTKNGKKWQVSEIVLLSVILLL